MRQPLVIRRGRYNLILPLGEGRLTRVYLAATVGAPQTPESLRVVKRLRPELAQQPRLCADFSAAAHLGTRLRHPQIAETYEVFTEGGEQLFAMEYLEGQTLADLLRRLGRERMPLEEHLHVLCQALVGLAHCHALLSPDGRPCGGNHREASASNIFITYDGQVKLLDFAVLEQLEPGLGARDDVHRGIGPFAPEQLCGLAVDARSDVFAMGILLWEALARRPRAVGEDRAALIAARVAGSEPGLEALPPGLPRELVDICARATELDPAGRYEGPAELAEALEAVRASFPRVAGAGDVATLLQRNFQLDRDALRRRINQHLEDSRSAVRLKTPPAVTPLPTTPSTDREVTVPGRIPARLLDTSRDSSSDETPLVPAGVGRRRLGLGLLGLGAAAMLIVGLSIALRDDPPAGDAAATRSAHNGPGWEPIAAPRVAVDRFGGPTRPAALVRKDTPTLVPTSQLPTQPEPSVARVAPPAPTRARPKRPAVNSLAAAELTRSTPVPLLDASGSLLSVPRSAVSPPRPMASDEPGRGNPSPSRRQLDEQDPYK